MIKFWRANKGKIIATLSGFSSSVFAILGVPKIDQNVFPELGLWRYLILFGLFVIVFILWLGLEWYIFKSKVTFYSSRLNSPYNDLSNVIKGCEKRILIVSIAGKSLTQSKSQEILKELIKKKAIQIKILISDPKSEFVQLRQKLEVGYEDSVKISERIRGAITVYRDLRKEVDPKNKGNFEYQIHGNFINQAILIVDDLMYVVPYLFSVEGKESPVFEIRKRYHQELFESFENDFHELWEKSYTPSDELHYSSVVI